MDPHFKSKVEKDEVLFVSPFYWIFCVSVSYQAPRARGGTEGGVQ